MSIRTILAAFACASAAGSAAALDVELKYESYRGPGSGGYRPYGYSMLHTTTTGGSDWKLPDLPVKPVLFAQVALGGGKRLLAIARKKAEDPFFNILYIDANGNEDLRDDAPVDAPPPPTEEGIRVSNGIEFDVEIELGEGGKKLPYAFRVIAFCPIDVQKIGEKEMAEQCRVYAMTNCCYRGEATIDGKKWRLMLADTNANGRFDEKASLPPLEDLPKWIMPIRCGGDQLYLTGREHFDYRDSNTLGDLLLLGDACYMVAVDLPAGKLSLLPHSEGLVTVKPAMAVERITFLADDGRVAMACNPGEKLRIPGGSWRPIEYQAIRKDAEGDSWRLCARLTRETASVPLADGGMLPIGEPFTGIATVPEYVYENFDRTGEIGEISLDFRLMGAAHEMVEELSRIEGTSSKIPRSEQSENRPKEPSYKVLKANGEVAAEGSFKYG